MPNLRDDSRGGEEPLLLHNYLNNNYDDKIAEIVFSPILLLIFDLSLGSVFCVFYRLISLAGRCAVVTAAL
jgi:hypothetical protein